MRMLSGAAALLLTGVVVFAQSKLFPEVSIDTNKPKVGEVAVFTVGGGTGPYIAKLVGDHMPPGEIQQWCLLQVNPVRTTGGRAVVEVKPLKPFEATLMIVDNAGHELKLPLAAHD